MARQEFSNTVIEIIRAIPRGFVATYGGIAFMAGSPQAARQVARILHACSGKEQLPWHRVVNREGRISLKPMQGYEEQRMLLEDEGVTFDAKGRIDLDLYLWRGRVAGEPGDGTRDFSG
ncbi:MGMT family protein [Desulforhopalus sp. IMCC35007]|uniref:MGMT family protein n=1 Tax=Desulforhopalus sp. IMCC35007 TaxID=2569543 RepID=UPI0010AE6874|nr:MGMT family protein [Desulforhopalus sp. IMCC35007]TKB08198.1 MGMT family protein [Desulforhopalus sp. IMCC35007]